MCIRDRPHGSQRALGQAAGAVGPAGRERAERNAAREQVRHCLLYTSDAADERSSVDLGGRRIINKTTKLATKSMEYQTENIINDHTTEQNKHSHRRKIRRQILKT